MEVSLSGTGAASIVINILIFVQDNPSEHVFLSCCNFWYKLAIVCTALAIVMIISAFPEIEDALLLAPSGTFQEASVDVVFTHCLQADYDDKIHPIVIDIKM